MYIAITIFAILGVLKALLHMGFAYSPSEGSVYNIFSTLMLCFIYAIGTHEGTSPLLLLFFIQLTLDAVLLGTAMRVRSPSISVLTSVRNVLERDRYTVSCHDKYVASSLGKSLAPYLILTVILYASLAVIVTN